MPRNRGADEAGARPSLNGRLRDSKTSRRGIRMSIPAEPIGSIPRTPQLLAAIATGDGTDPRLDPLYDEAIRETIAECEATGSPVITDGEQRKYHNFWT
jgi:hypothetical protein